MKDYLLKLPAELHKRLKIAAFMQEKTMMAFILEAIEEKIQRQENK